MASTLYARTAAVVAAAAFILGAAGCAALAAVASEHAAPDAASVPAGVTAPAGPRDCAPAPAVLESPGRDPTAQALRHYLRGRLHMSNQDSILAMEEFRQAASLRPDIARLWMNLGLVQYDSGSAAAAVASLEKALALDPKDEATLYFRSRIAASQGDLPAASEYVQRLMDVAEKGSPYHILGLYHLARVKQNVADLDASIAAYQELFDQLATPKPFFQRFPELFLVYRSQLQLKQQLAALLMKKERHDEAIVLLQEVLAARPDNSQLLLLLAAAYRAKGDLPRALEWARKVIEVSPDGDAGYRLLVELHKEKGTPNDVIPELEACRRRSPNNEALAWQLAAAYKTAGRDADALAIYNELSRGAGQGDDAVQAALKAAEVHAEKGEFAEALSVLAGTMKSDIASAAVLVRAAKLIDGLTDPGAVYRDAQRLVADDVRAYGPFIMVGMLAEKLKRYSEAVTLYDKALVREPKAAIAVSRKADLLIASSLHEEALNVYRKAVAAGLNLPVFHRKMGMILEHLDRPDEALAEYRTTRKAAPEDKPTRYLLASLLARQGQFAEAEEELTTLLAREPKEIQAYCQLAEIKMIQGDLDAAERQVAKALAVEPKAALARMMLAELRLRQKRYEDAERLAREMLVEQPGDHDVRLIRVYALAGMKRNPEAAAEVRALLAANPEKIGWRYLLAGLYQESGQRDDAEKELQTILQREPNHAPSNNDLGYMWAERGVNLPQAEQMIRKALQFDPESAAYLDSLGWVLYKQGRFEDAVRALEQATERSPELDAVLWEHLGDGYWRLKRADDAAKAWEKSVSIHEAAKKDAEPDAQRVRRKVESIRAGAAPDVAPAGASGPPPQPQAKTQPQP
jgi:tetratricopeptide (TPR) repeat protein